MVTKKGCKLFTKHMKNEIISNESSDVIEETRKQFIKDLGYDITDGANKERFKADIAKFEENNTIIRNIVEEGSVNPDLNKGLKVGTFTRTANALLNSPTAVESINIIRNLQDHGDTMNGLLKEVFSYKHEYLSEESRQKIFSQYVTQLKKHIEKMKKDGGGYIDDLGKEKLIAEARAKAIEIDNGETRLSIGKSIVGDSTVVDNELAKKIQQEYLLVVDNMVGNLKGAGIDIEGLAFSKGLNYNTLRQDITESLKIPYLSSPKVQKLMRERFLTDARGGVDAMNTDAIDKLTKEMIEQGYLVQGKGGVGSELITLWKQKQVVNAKNIKDHRLNYAGYLVFKEELLQREAGLTNRQILESYRLNILGDTPSFLYGFKSKPGKFDKLLGMSRRISNLLRFTASPFTAGQFAAASTVFGATKYLGIKNAAEAAYPSGTMDHLLAAQFMKDNKISDGMEYFTASYAGDLGIDALDGIPGVEVQNGIASYKKGFNKGFNLATGGPQSWIEGWYASQTKLNNFILACKEVGIESSDDLTRLQERALKTDVGGLDAKKTIEQLRGITYRNIDAGLRGSGVKSLNAQGLSKYWMFNYLGSYTYRTVDELFTGVRKLGKWMKEDGFSRKGFQDHLDTNPQIMAFIMTTLNAAQMSFKINQMINRGKEGDEKVSTTKYIMNSNEYLESLDSLFVLNVLKEAFKPFQADKVNNIEGDNYDLKTSFTAGGLMALSKITTQFLRETRPLTSSIFETLKGTLRKQGIESNLGIEEPETSTMEHAMLIFTDTLLKKSEGLSRWNKLEGSDVMGLEKVEMDGDGFTDSIMATADINESLILATKYRDLASIENIIYNKGDFFINNVFANLPILENFVGVSKQTTSPASTLTKLVKNFTVQDKVMNDLYNGRRNPKIMLAPGMIDTLYSNLIEMNYYGKPLLDGLESNIEWETSNDLATMAKVTMTKEKEKLFMKDLANRLGYEGTEKLIEEIYGAQKASIEGGYKVPNMDHMIKAMAAAEAKSTGSAKILISFLVGQKFSEYKNENPLDLDGQEKMKARLIHDYYPYLAQADTEKWWNAMGSYAEAKNPGIFKGLASDPNYSTFANMLGFNRLMINNELRKGNIDVKGMSSVFSFATTFVKDPAVRVTMANQLLDDIDNMDHATPTQKHSLKLGAVTGMLKDLGKLKEDKVFVESHGDILAEAEEKIFGLDGKLQNLLIEEATKAIKDKLASGGSGSSYNPWLSQILGSGYRKKSYGGGSQYGQGGFANKAFNDLQKKFPKSSYDSPSYKQSAPYTPPKNLAFKLPGFNVKIVRQLISAHTKGLVSKELSSGPVRGSKAPTKSTGRRLPSPKPTPTARRRQILSPGSLRL